MGSNRYADVVRISMKSKENAQGRPVTTVDLAKHVGCSYEHLRKVLQGWPFISEDLNAAVCEYLGLDAGELWQMALRDKLTKRYGTAVMELPKNTRLAQAFRDLNEVDQQRIIEYAEVLATASREIRAATKGIRRRRRTA